MAKHGAFEKWLYETYTTEEILTRLGLNIFDLEEEFRGEYEARGGEEAGIKERVLEGLLDQATRWMESVTTAQITWEKTEQGFDIIVSSDYYGESRRYHLTREEVMNTDERGIASLVLGY